MAYVKQFTNPYPDGWVGLPIEETPIDAEALQAHTDAIEGIDNYLAENPPDELKESLTQYEQDGFLSRNLFDGNGVGTFYVNNGKYVNDSSVRGVYIKCKPNTTYTISRMSGGSRFRIYDSANIPTSNGDCIAHASDDSATSNTATTSASAQYLYAFIWRSADTMTWEEMKASIQIEEGTVAHAYTPYAMSNVGLTQIVEEQKGFFTQQQDAGFLQKNINDASLKTLITSSGAEVASNDQTTTEYKPNLNGFITCSWSACNGALIIVGKYNSNKTFISRDVLRITSESFKTFNLGDCAFFKVCYDDNSTSHFSNFQIEYGTVAHAYTPYAPSNTELKQSLAQCVQRGSEVGSSVELGITTDYYVCPSDGYIRINTGNGSGDNNVVVKGNVDYSLLRVQIPNSCISAFVPKGLKIKISAKDSSSTIRFYPLV